MFLHWRRLFDDILPPDAKGIIAVFENSCGQAFTYRIDGRYVDYVGPGDLHDERFDYLENSVSLTESFNDKNNSKVVYSGPLLSRDNCQYKLRVYPPEDTESQYLTATPVIYTVGVVLIFLFTSIVFLAYDRFVERRQKMVLNNALQSGAIVSSMFPDAIRDRLMQEAEENTNMMKAGSYASNNRKLKTFLNDDTHGKGKIGGPAVSAPPLADLFPDCTVLFADIANFTAWSSTRDPSQVFMLLQTVYQGFDAVAKRRHVFKVETVGDCYVAVAGLPEPQEDHASIMARFASDCLARFKHITRNLEVSLGPDTGDLQMRLGLHSGPGTICVVLCLLD